MQIHSRHVVTEFFTILLNKFLTTSCIWQPFLIILCAWWPLLPLLMCPFDWFLYRSLEKKLAKYVHWLRETDCKFCHSVMGKYHEICQSSVWKKKSRNRHVSCSKKSRNSSVGRGKIHEICLSIPKKSRVSTISWEKSRNLTTVQGKKSWNSSIDLQEKSSTFVHQLY